MKKIFTLLLVAGLAATTHAQAPDPDTTAQHFIIMASIGNLQEVNAGKLASQKATREDVKAFGKMMVTDHSLAEKKLLQLIKDKGYRIPAAATDVPVPDPVLANASGDDFDRMYIHAMAAGHRSTVLMYETYAATGKAPEVKAFAQQMLPALREHLAVINALDKKYKDLAAK